MFSALRLNNIVYILDKKESPTLKKGTVVSVTAPKPKTNTIYGLSMNMVVDVEVNIDGVKELFKEIPANLSIATDSNLVISESREAMCTEVESMITVSRLILDSVPYHNNVIETCDEMLKELNPLFAKEKEQEAKICILEDKVTGIESSLSDIKTMLSKALNK